MADVLQGGVHRPIAFSAMHDGFDKLTVPARCWPRKRCGSERIRGSMVRHRRPPRRLRQDVRRDRTRHRCSGRRLAGGRGASLELASSSRRPSCPCVA